MKNIELQKLLAAMPDDAEVMVCDWNEEYAPPYSLSRVRHDVESRTVFLQESE